MKVKKQSKYIFSIMILLSTCSVWIISSDFNLSVFQKTIYICLNFMYLFLVAEFIEMIMHRNMIMNVFDYKMYFPLLKYYKLYNIVLPIVSMLIYVFAWTLYLSAYDYSFKTSAILILMSGSCISYSFFSRKKMVFANNNTIAFNNQLISYSIIKTYDLKTEKLMGINKNEVTVCLISGDKCTFNVESKYLNELIKNLSKDAKIV